MTPQLAAEWAADAGLIRAVARLGRAEQDELARIDSVFHQRLDAEYGPDERRWPGGARYAYVSTVAAVHRTYQRKATTR